MSKKKEKFKSRNLRLLLYPDDPSHVEALEIIKKEFEYAMILHDKDLENDDDCKKPHYHLVLRFPNAKWNTALAKELGIKENYVRDCVNLNKALGYLIHFFNPEKYQYDFEEVNGSQTLKDILWSIILKANKTQEELSNEILDYIENSGTIRYIDFMRWINANGLFSNMKSGSGWYRDVIKEHNQYIERLNHTTQANINSSRHNIFEELTQERRDELFQTLKGGDNSDTSKYSQISFTDMV